jgi:hypothetical protein
MWVGRCRGAMKLALGGSLLIAVAALQILPRPLGAGQADASVGGCSAGFCTGGVTRLCGSVGDACGGYAVCQNAANGDFICTPHDFCTAAGCTVVHGGNCY